MVSLISNASFALVEKRLESIIDKYNSITTKNPTLIIKDVKINVIGETKKVVIKQLIHFRVGQRLDTFNVIDLAERLFSLRILTKVEFVYEVINNEVVITCKVIDKYSFFPIPLLYIFDDTILGGLVLVESNLLGYNKGASLGGIVSNRGWQYIVGYDDPNIFYTNFYGRIRSTGGSVFIENKTSNNDLIQQYQAFRYDVLYQLGYTFFNTLSLSNTGGLYVVQLPSKDNIESINIPNEVSTFYLGAKIILNTYKNRFYYDLGLRSTLEFQRGFKVGIDGEEFYSLIGENSYTLESFFDHTLSVGAYWSYSNMPTVLERRLGGLEGTRTLPALLIPADKYINTAIIYQIPIFNFSWATVTLLNFFEYGQFQRDNDPFKIHYGPGGGFRFYLKGITIPALGIDFAYDMVSKNIWTSIAIGFRPTR